MRPSPQEPHTGPGWTRRQLLQSAASGCALTLAPTLITACGGADSPPWLQAAIDEGRSAVAQEMRRTGATTVSLALFDDQGVLWSQADGVENGAGSPMTTTETLFPCASLSKIVSTTAVLRLIDRGAFKLDTPLTDILSPEVFSMPLDLRYRQITVRMLLAHSCALPGNDDRDANSAEPRQDYSIQMTKALRYQRLKHDPGALCAYNNDGFTLLEPIVAAASKRDYLGFVQSEVFDALGMRQARHHDRAMPETGWVKTLLTDSAVPIVMNAYASGGVYATPTDLARLGRVFLNQGRHGAQPYLSAGLVAATGSDQTLGTFNPLPCEAYRFGLGWDTVAQPGLASQGVVGWQKTGDFPSLGTNLVVIPAEGLGVVVFCAGGHTDSDAAVRISERILLRALVARGRLAAMPPALSTADRPTRSVPDGQHSDIVGDYTGSRGVFRLSSDGNMLTLAKFIGDPKKPWEDLHARLSLRDDGWYAADGDPVTALKPMAIDGRRYLAERVNLGRGHYTTQRLLCEQLPERALLGEPWRSSAVAETWLPVNDHFAESFLSALSTGPVVQLQALPGRSDYLVGAGNNALRAPEPPDPDRLDGSFLRLPYAGKDLKEAAIDARGWLRSGSTLYQPLSRVVEIDSAQTLSIAFDADAQWCRCTRAGSLRIDGARTWLIYDHELNWRADSRSATSSVAIQAGDLVLVYAVPGASVTLQVSTV